MKKTTWLLPLVIVTMHAYAQKKEDRRTLNNLQSHINYLSSDKVAGRSTGAPGEQLAAAYISSHLKQSGLTPGGDDGFLQTFTIKETREPSSNCQMTIDDTGLTPGKQFIPLPFSAEKTASGEAMAGVTEPDNIWLINVAEMEPDGHKSPVEQYLHQAQVAEKSGATGVVFYNGKESIATVSQWLDQRPKTTGIPAVWVSQDISKKLAADDASQFKFHLQVAFNAVKRNGTNVVGLINNKAHRTIIIGAHYDHPGWGNKNSGDDNASAAAALLELARMLSGSRFHNNNYIIIAFSGKEQGLYGSKYFASHSPVDLSEVNYMINMDGIGHLSPGKALQVGGTGTSPGWATVLQQASVKDLPVVYDSSGINTADHVSFYQKNIPVLYFCSDANIADNSVNNEGTLGVLKLVYNIIDKTNNKDKLAFTSIQ